MALVGFFSYSRKDNDSLHGILHGIHNELQSTLRRVLGRSDIEVFLDEEAINSGQIWKQRLDQAVVAAPFLFPVLSPSYLSSQACCEEFSMFLQHEKQLLPSRSGNADGLILPISFIPQWKDQSSDIVQVLKERQYVDLEFLQHGGRTSTKAVRKILAKLAQRVSEMLIQMAAVRESGDRLSAVDILKTAKGTALSEEQHERHHIKRLATSGADISGENTVFISHAKEDSEFVNQELVEMLYEAGVSALMSEHRSDQMPKTDSAVDQGLQVAPWFLVVLSKPAVECVKVQKEVAWACENRPPERIIPILIDACEFQKLHVLLRLTTIIQCQNDNEMQSKLLERFRSSAMQRQSGMEGQSRNAGICGSGESKKEVNSIVKAPVFHCGSVVPPQFFVGRTNEIDMAEQLIEGGHNFLLVGNHRDGKTSLLRILMHRIIANPTNRVLPVYLNVQNWPDLTIETFLEHTIIGMIGEISRQIFGCKFSSLRKWANSSQSTPLNGDIEFDEFVGVYRHVRDRTFAQHHAIPDPFRADEFLHIHSDLLEIIHTRGWGRCVVFYDEANRLRRELPADRLSSHEETLAAPGRMSVYAASPAMAESFMQLRSSFRHEVRLPPFTATDVQSLLSLYYYGDSDRNDLPVSADAIDRLVAMSEGCPYMVQVLAEIAFEIAKKRQATFLTYGDVLAASAIWEREKKA